MTSRKSDQLRINQLNSDLFRLMQRRTLFLLLREARTDQWLPLSDTPLNPIISH